MSTVTPITHTGLAPDDYVEFWRAGALATGVFCCVECGHTASSIHRLPHCPDCFGRLWEDASTSPFGGGEKDAADGGGAAGAVVLALAAGPLLWLAAGAWAYALFRLIAR